jgi:hypothetical protein
MTSKRSLRRHLIKGALAAPAVFTVRTASAQARSSANVCLVRDAAQAAARRPAPLTTADVDDWVRKPVDVMQLSVYQGRELKPVEGRFILGADQSRYWKIVESQGARGTMAMPSSYTVGRCVASKTGEVRHALVYVDGNGNQVGLAFEPRNGTAATNSCMTSMLSSVGNAARRI